MAATSNTRRANGSARTRLLKWVRREYTHCHLCGAPVNTALPHGRPGSPEADEVIPVSHGGDPLDRNNVRLAHRLCNQTRQAAPVALAREIIAAKQFAYGPDGHLVQPQPLATAQSRVW